MKSNKKEPRIENKILKEYVASVNFMGRLLKNISVLSEQRGLFFPTYFYGRLVCSVRRLMLWHLQRFFDWFIECVVGEMGIEHGLLANLNSKSRHKNFVIFNIRMKWLYSFFYKKWDFPNSYIILAFLINLCMYTHSCSSGCYFLRT